jgi:hypothetical protein
MEIPLGLPHCTLGALRVRNLLLCCCLVSSDDKVCDREDSVQGTDLPGAVPFRLMRGVMEPCGCESCACLEENGVYSAV